MQGRRHVAPRAAGRQFDSSRNSQLRHSNPPSRHSNRLTPGLPPRSAPAVQSQTIPARGTAPMRDPGHVSRLWTYGGIASAVLLGAGLLTRQPWFLVAAGVFSAPSGVLLAPDFRGSAGEYWRTQPFEFPTPPFSATGFARWSGVCLGLMGALCDHDDPHDSPERSLSMLRSSVGLRLSRASSCVKAKRDGAQLRGNPTLRTQSSEQMEPLTSQIH